MTAHVTVFLLMNTSDYEEGVAKARAMSGELENDMGSSGTRMGDKMATGFRTSTKGLGGVFTSLGNQASSLGLPFSNTFTKIGASIQATTTKSGALKESLEGLGKVSLFAGIAGGVAAAAEGVKLWDGYEKALTFSRYSRKEYGR